MAGDWLKGKEIRFSIVACQQVTFYQLVSLALLPPQHHDGVFKYRDCDWKHYYNIQKCA